VPTGEIPPTSSVPDAGGFPRERCVAPRTPRESAGFAIDQRLRVGSWAQALTAGVRTATAPRYVEDLAVLDARCEHIDHLAALGTPLELAHRSAPGGAVISSRNPQVASGKRGQKGDGGDKWLPALRLRRALATKKPPASRRFSDGETRTRTGDTTIFRQMSRTLERWRKDLQTSRFEGVHREARCRAISARM
jgi:hypothetical protein